MKANIKMKKELDRFIRIAEKLLEAESREGVVKPLPYDELCALLDLDLEEEGEGADPSSSLSAVGLYFPSSLQSLRRG